MATDFGNYSGDLDLGDKSDLTDISSSVSLWSNSFLTFFGFMLAVGLNKFPQITKTWRSLLCVAPIIHNAWNIYRISLKGSSKPPSPFNVNFSHCRPSSDSFEINFANYDRFVRRRLLMWKNILRSFTSRPWLWNWVCRSQLRYP